MDLAGSVTILYTGGFRTGWDQVNKVLFVNDYSITFLSKGRETSLSLEQILRVLITPLEKQSHQ